MLICYLHKKYGKHNCGDTSDNNPSKPGFTKRLRAVPIQFAVIKRKYES